MGIITTMNMCFKVILKGGGEEEKETKCGK